MEIGESPSPRKPVSPYLIASGVIVVLALVAFVAVRYMNAGGRSSNGDNGLGGNLIQSEELPETEPQTMGVLVERDDNMIIVSPADSIRIMAPGSNQAGEPKMEADYVGDKVEVVISNETMIYQDVTPMNMENADKDVQQVLELSTIDVISPESVITVWGRKNGDRIVADVVLFLSPFQ
ncbi:MAG: hypothetical protein JNM55_15285 [Anaerolineales bacterium]|nr:hypothetical protein [Anaerolineales bacterium]